MHYIFVYFNFPIRRLIINVLCQSGSGKPVWARPHKGVYKANSDPLNRQLKSRVASVDHEIMETALHPKSLTIEIE
jgi:hypothetical protein